MCGGVCCRGGRDDGGAGSGAVGGGNAGGGDVPPPRAVDGPQRATHRHGVAPKAGVHAEAEGGEVPFEQKVRYSEGRGGAAQGGVGYVCRLAVGLLRGWATACRRPLCLPAVGERVCILLCVSFSV